MTAITNTENLRQYQGRFSLIVEEILTFASSTNLVSEVKSNSKYWSKFQANCRTMFRVIKYSHADRSIHFFAKLETDPPNAILK